MGKYQWIAFDRRRACVIAVGKQKQNCEHTSKPVSPGALMLGHGIFPLSHKRTQIIDKLHTVYFPVRRKVALNGAPLDLCVQVFESFVRVEGCMHPCAREEWEAPQMQKH